MPVLSIDRGQTTLFPERLEDWIGEDNPVRVVDVFVEELVVRRRAPGAFPPNTVDLIKTFAAQSAVAIENARLFRDVEASLDNAIHPLVRMINLKALFTLLICGQTSPTLSAIPASWHVHIGTRHAIHQAWLSAHWRGCWVRYEDPPSHAAPCLRV